MTVDWIANTKSVVLNRNEFFDSQACRCDAPYLINPYQTGTNPKGSAHGRDVEATSLLISI